MEMTKKGPVNNNSESTKLARVTSLLKTLDTWLRLFHDSVEDMTRSEALIVVFHLNANGENKSELVEHLEQKLCSSLSSFFLKRGGQLKKKLYQPGALSYKRFWNQSVLRHSPPALASFLRQALGKQGPSLQ